MFGKFKKKKLSNPRYEILEYIIGTGGQFINLPYGFYNTDQIEIKGSITNLTGDKFMIAPTSWNTNMNRFAMIGQGSTYMTFGYGNESTAATAYYPQTAKNSNVHTFTYKNKLFKCEDLNISRDVTSIAFGSETSNLRLFYGYNSITTGTIASFKQIKANNNKLNMVAARRISDNVLGMYDYEHDTFYTNNGSGTFGAGSVIGYIY